jgi:hypothetical protein
MNPDKPIGGTDVYLPLRPVGLEQWIVVIIY